MRKNKIAKFLLIGIASLSLIVLYVRMENESYHNYMNTFDLATTGKVVEVYNLNDDSYRHPITCLEVTESNYQIFDQRDSLSEFYILQLRGYAVFYDSGDSTNRNFFEQGDLVKIDGIKKRLEWFDQDNKFKSQNRLSLYDEFFAPYHLFAKYLDHCEDSQNE